MAADQMMGADQPAATGADDDEATGTDTSQGYCIEIRVGADGKVSVGVESLADEQSEEGGAGEGEEDGGEGDEYQPVDSFSAALKLAKEIYAHAGSMADMSASQDEMNSGYGAKAGA